MNEIIEKVNFSEGSYWGEPGKFKFRVAIDSFDDATELADRERIVRSSFSFSCRGYLMPDSINKAISTIFNTEIEVTGSGRTDAGVHAKQMFAHFDLLEEFDISQTISKLNGVLPKDIAIINIYKVNENAHSRFDAISRTYHYYLIQQKNFPHIFNTIQVDRSEES